MEDLEIIGKVSAARDKRFPPCLVVKAEIIMYSANATGELVVVEPQGTNEKILILKAIFRESGPMKGVIKSVRTFEWCDMEVQKLTQVQIIYNGVSKTLDIID